MKAYHFLQDDMRSGCGDEPPWKIGEEREHKGNLVMCASGYHAAPSWRDALRYAPGAMACIVKLSGDIIKDGDKCVAQKRKLIDARDATRVLRTLACDCAERVLKRAKVTDKRSWKAIRITRLYNEGQATSEELYAARDAAQDVAQEAARDVAWFAAQDVAWFAAWVAAEDAARATARVAARDAAHIAAEDAIWDVAWFAEVAWQKRHLNKLMKALFQEARR